jgi:hypothetical protein
MTILFHPVVSVFERTLGFLSCNVRAVFAASSLPIRRSGLSGALFPLPAAGFNQAIRDHCMHLERLQLPLLLTILFLQLSPIFRRKLFSGLLFDFVENKEKDFLRTFVAKHSVFAGIAHISSSDICRTIDRKSDAIADLLAPSLRV